MLYTKKIIHCDHPSGTHKIVYEDWGDPQNPDIVICVHGLTRNAVDFTWLCQALSPRFRMICPDMPGRGRSDPLPDAALYTYAQYTSDLLALIAHLKVDRIFWVGTSMGGLIGMNLAALPHTRIHKLVLNDIGPEVPLAGLQRLSTYAPYPQTFQDFEGVISFLKSIQLGYTHLTEDQWHDMAKRSACWDDTAHVWRLLYDEKAAAQLSHPLQPLDFWAPWHTLTCPVLVLRGGDSDILSAETFDRMCQKPQVQGTTFPGEGHALSLATPEQITLIQTWFEVSLSPSPPDTTDDF